MSGRSGNQRRSDWAASQPRRIEQWSIYQTNGRCQLKRTGKGIVRGGTHSGEDVNIVSFTGNDILDGLDSTGSTTDDQDLPRM